VSLAEIFLATVGESAGRRKNRQRRTQEAPQLGLLAEGQVSALSKVPEQKPFDGHQPLVLNPLPSFLPSP
jgi:hypothetical protein